MSGARSPRNAYSVPRNLKPLFSNAADEVLGPLFAQDGGELCSHIEEDLHTTLWNELLKCLDKTTGMDSGERFARIARSLQPIILQHLVRSSHSQLLIVMEEWYHRCSALLLETYVANRDAYSMRPDATPLLGAASSRMYKFVRRQLGVPFLRSSYIRSPEPERVILSGETRTECQPNENDVPTVGSLITIIYSALRSGELYVPVVECMRTVRGKL